MHTAGSTLVTSHLEWLYSDAHLRAETKAANIIVQLGHGSCTISQPCGHQIEILFN